MATVRSASLIMLSSHLSYLLSDYSMAASLPMLKTITCHPRFFTQILLAVACCLLLAAPCSLKKKTTALPLFNHTIIINIGGNFSWEIGKAAASANENQYQQSMGQTIEKVALQLTRSASAHSIIHF